MKRKIDEIYRFDDGNIGEFIFIKENLRLFSFLTFFYFSRWEYF